MLLIGIIYITYTVKMFDFLHIPYFFSCESFHSLTFHFSACIELRIGSEVVITYCSKYLHTCLYCSYTKHKNTPLCIPIHVKSIGNYVCVEKMQFLSFHCRFFSTRKQYWKLCVRRINTVLILSLSFLPQSP